MFLTCSLNDKLRPTLAALEQVLGSRAEVARAVSKATILAVITADTIHSNVEVMRGFGLSDDPDPAVCDQAAAAPFERDYAGEVMHAKFIYFEAVLGWCPREMLLSNPASLKSGLRGIDYKVGACNLALLPITWLHKHGAQPGHMGSRTCFPPYLIATLVLCEEPTTRAPNAFQTGIVWQLEAVHANCALHFT